MYGVYLVSPLYCRSHPFSIMKRSVHRDGSAKVRLSALVDFFIRIQFKKIPTPAHVYLYEHDYHFTTTRTHNNDRNKLISQTYYHGRYYF